MQDICNIYNEFGDILKLTLVQSASMFDVSDLNVYALVDFCFVYNPPITSKVGEYIIDLSIHLIIEELGLKLWEKHLETYIYHVHNFLNILYIFPG